jgi:hypothetical protein
MHIVLVVFGIINWMGIYHRDVGKYVGMDILLLTFVIILRIYLMMDATIIVNLCQISHAK